VTCTYRYGVQWFPQNGNFRLGSAETDVVEVFVTYRSLDTQGIQDRDFNFSKHSANVGFEVLYRSQVCGYSGVQAVTLCYERALEAGVALGTPLTTNRCLNHTVRHFEYVTVEYNVNVTQFVLCITVGHCVAQPVNQLLAVVGYAGNIVRRARISRAEGVEVFI